MDYVLRLRYKSLQGKKTDQIKDQIQINQAVRVCFNPSNHLAFPSQQYKYAVWHWCGSAWILRLFCRIIHYNCFSVLFPPVCSVEFAPALKLTILSHLEFKKEGPAIRPILFLFSSVIFSLRFFCYAVFSNLEIHSFTSAISPSR